PADTCPLSGAKRTLVIVLRMSVPDPKRKYGPLGVSSIGQTKDRKGVCVGMAPEASTGSASERARSPDLLTKSTSLAWPSRSKILALIQTECRNWARIPMPISALRIQAYQLLAFAIKADEESRPADRVVLTTLLSQDAQWPSRSARRPIVPMRRVDRR